MRVLKKILNKIKKRIKELKQKWLATTISCDGIFVMGQSCDVKNSHIAGRFKGDRRDKLEREKESLKVLIATCVLVHRWIQETGLVE